jgi:glycosyltransferase involved in cell wall biosynthesis
MRIGICWSGSGWSSDPHLDSHVRRLLDALAATSRPPEVVVTGCEDVLELALAPATVSRLRLRTVKAGLSPLQDLLFQACRAWLRRSNWLQHWRTTGTGWFEDAARQLAMRWCGAAMGWQLLAFGLLLLVWPVIALTSLALAFAWGLGFPLWMTDRVVRRLEFWLAQRKAAPLRAQDCAIWWVPYPLSWPLRDMPAVLMLPTFDHLQPGMLPQPAQGIADAASGACHASLATTLDGDAPTAQRLRRLGLPAGHVRSGYYLENLEGDELAEHWLEWSRQAIDLAPAARGLDPVLFKPWPVEAARSHGETSPLSVFLFLQIAWGGGNWEHTRELVRALAELTDRDGRLRLSLGIHATQQGGWALPPSVPVHRCHFNSLSRNEALRLGVEVRRRLADRPESSFCFLSGGADAALEADAWLALSDRFPLPLLPARPYGVVVHDMIHRHVPEALGPVFFRNLVQGMTPTIRHAERVIVTSPGTAQDVLEEYRLPSVRVELIPVACSPEVRFGRLPSGFVPLPRRDFILNVTNASPHKGADLVLRAYAKLRDQLGSATPLLVLCGIGTEYLAERHGQAGPRYWSACRELQRELGLREDRDVVFLGTVTDIELKDLYQRCQAVINAARHDNGTYCLIEAAWFGKEAVSTRYPGAEFLAERFSLPVRFVPLDDPQALAAALAEVLHSSPLQPEELMARRTALARPSLGVEAYAAALYRVLLELATQGRSDRQWLVAPRRSDLCERRAG